MIIKDGFEFEGFKFGFKSKILYRLSGVKNGRNYKMRVVPVIQLSETGEGYRLCRQKKSLLQVQSMVQKVNWSIKNKCRECR